MYYVYILKSLKDNDLYTGFTEDLKRRFQEHQQGSSASTRSRRPFRLVYYEAYASKKDAVARERNLKLRSKALCQLKRRIVESLIGVGEESPNTVRPSNGTVMESR